MPLIVSNSIRILSDGRLGMAMFSLGKVNKKKICVVRELTSTTRAASEATGGLASAAGSEERTAASTARPGSEERSAASTARSGSASRSLKRKGMERGEDEAAA